MLQQNLVGEVLQGHYQVISQLGGGGFGDTFLAIDTSKFNRQCVVKRLKPQNQSTMQWVEQAFEREARMLEALGRHPRIPDLLGFFQEQQEFFLVQEFISGSNLRAHLIRGQQWDENRVIFILQNILEVLEFVHQHGVVHRDIKPDNLILQNPNNQIVLIDFGAVKQISTQVFNTQGQVASTTYVVGTQGYMPIEQMRGHPMLCSDIYAVGMIGIEALTGVFPHELGTDPNTFEVIWRPRVLVSEDFARVLSTMTAYHPSQRYQNATLALQAIRELTQTVLPSSVRQTPPPQPVTTNTNVRYAGFSTRFAADIIDKTILIIASFMFDFMTNGAANADGFWGRLFFYYIVIGFVYATVMESSAIQGTVGKMLLGIAVTDASGNRITFEQSAKRYFSKILSYITFLFGFFIAGFTNKKQTLHDIVSKSLVIRKSR
ncbi:serine/threonine protein kinase [Rivularia sp. IAM M-261]|mgnify:FL=1|nr:serine/threonine protein kinase [Calothrix sp. PCC 7716]GJD20455.1 serine/threonine protein kinase [Rivularia sp. IAM M-261]